MIERYLAMPYRDGGRTATGVDCYGLVRLVRAELFGMPLLPLHAGVRVDDKRSMTRIARKEAGGLAPCGVEDGAIAVCWQRGICLHVGVVAHLDGRPGVLEASSKRGIGWRPLNVFERDYQMVEYYT